MKVKFTPMMKEILRVSELPAAHEVINMMKEDTGLKEYAAIAARLAACDNTAEVLKADAEICKNCRVFNRYSDTSRDIDVWINVYAYAACKGFYIIGVCLSDIWDLTAENSNVIRDYMYIREFTENE